MSAICCIRNDREAADDAASQRACPKGIEAGVVGRLVQSRSKFLTPPANQLQLARRGAAALWEKRRRDGSTAPKRHHFSVQYT